MGGPELRIGVLTSSRADYGIYKPLLAVLDKDPDIELIILIFGAHLSEKHGNTSEVIINDGFTRFYKLNSVPEDDKPGSIGRSMAETIKSFSDLWENVSFDLIIALGDRYEMFSAVSSTIPFNIRVAHIHGGETTLGAIDNSFRHCITSIAKIHFTSCEEYRLRVAEIKGSEINVFNVGALSIDVLSKMEFLTKDQFFSNYGIDLGKPTILFTFHPETVDYKNNETYINTLINVLHEVTGYQVVITMPNADTESTIIREKLKLFINDNPRVFGIETFGSVGYLSCMRYCSMMIGNSSSGFVEASWLQTPVINVGERQKGRIITSNIISCKIEKDDIIEAIRFFENNKTEPVVQRYGSGNTAEKIVTLIKEFLK